MNMKVQTDHELLTDLLKQLNVTDNNENRKTILTDLEFYLHQVCQRDSISIENVRNDIVSFSMIMPFYFPICTDLNY